MLRRIFKGILRRVYPLISSRGRATLCLDRSLSEFHKATILRAAKHYQAWIPGRFVITESKNPKLMAMLHRSGTIFLTGKYRNLRNHFPLYLCSCYAVDPTKDALAAWGWHSALCGIEGTSCESVRTSQRAFKALIERLKARRLNRCYIFGTGPSLAQAKNHNFLGGYRIVCNTIIRDADLMYHLDPDILVAGDALYHFSETEHACAFRRDLKARMRETNLTFCYPDLFAPFIRKEFAEFRDRCIGIPYGKACDLTRDLTKEFTLPKVGNILGQMLLPLACTLAKEVAMLGFDGRKPTDKLFWQNSEGHSYPTLIDKMTKEYPAFYDEYVPKSDPFSYVSAYHGDVLDAIMSKAEEAGWQFVMLSPSTSPALAKRSMLQLD
jgi:hypothetical protein